MALADQQKCCRAIQLDSVHSKTLTHQRQTPNLRRAADTWPAGGSGQGSSERLQRGRGGSRSGAGRPRALGRQQSN